MKLQVQPLSLKVLATRVVVINRMDYSTHLTGATKDELDRLDKLAGRYKIQSSKLTIEALYNGKKMPLDDWEYFKECFGRGLPNHLVKFIESTEEFTIFECQNRLRNWLIYDKFLWGREFFTTIKDWSHCDDFIEDGRLVSIVKGFLKNNSKTGIVVDCREYITTDKEGNIIWEFIWSLPKLDIKIKKIIRAIRVLGIPRFPHYLKRLRVISS